jgi:lysophospholipase L1-like esterase
VDLEVPALASIAVSIHLDQPPARQTSHPGSRATSYLVHGDRTAATDLPDARRVDHWFQLSGVDVATRGQAVVALGDSITDGHGATTNGDDRWPDVLAGRLHASARARNVGVLNLGIGGNRVLLDGLGPNALARFDRDVLAQSGVRTVVLLEGINDIGTLTREAPAAPEAHAALVRNVTAAYRQIVTRAHAHGLRVLGATLTPFAGSDYYHPGPASEVDRQAINAWIRTRGHFDGVVDFDKAVRDPADPQRMAARYDSGDHLHPSPAGYRAMAAAISLPQAAP